MDTQFVRMVPGDLEMGLNSDLKLFHLVDWSLDYKNAREEDVHMKVKLKRKPKSELLTTFLPTVLLTMISFATSFFKPFFFEAALSVNLTTMLVMTTIFISKMEGLPPTSDIKMIDIWLVLCQMVPFAEVVLLTAMEYNRNDDEQNEIMLMEMRNENLDEDEPEEKQWKRWTPQLKTLGNILHHFFDIDKAQRIY